MQKIAIPVLIITLILLAFWAKTQGNIPLLLTLAFLLMLASWITFFSLKLEPQTGFHLFLLSLLINVVGIFKMIQRDFKLQWIGVFFLGSIYFLLLKSVGWFKTVKKGVKYIGYFVFATQLVFSVFLIGINQSFIKEGAWLFFIHSLIFLFILTKTETKPQDEKSDN